MPTTTLTPDGVALTLTAGSPGLVSDTGIAPDALSLSITAGTPDLLTGVNTTLTPTSAALTTTRGTPTITGATTILGPTATTIVVSGSAPFVTIQPPSQIDTIWNATRANKLAEENTRRGQPLLRLWNAEWQLQHVLGNEYRAQFSFISNDTGPGQLEIPYDSSAAAWVHDHQGRIARGEGRNVYITVDHCGARWSGIMDKYSIEKRDDGDVVLVMDFLHDYEHLKWYTLWSNPWLPAAFQVPRAFVLAGPVSWVIRTSLFLNIVREHNPLITWPDDPMNLASWFTSLDQSNWHVVVKPQGFLEAMASGVTWGVLFSRWANFHDAAHIMLEDAELSVRCDRYLPGDPPPWPGANLRYGTLVIDVVDKSGVNIGTSYGGTVFDGLVRTVNEFFDDFIDSTSQLISDADVPAGYYNKGNKYTDKVMPYVVWQEGENSPIETSAWINSPAKGVQVAVGGHSMPGVACAPSGNRGGAGHTGTHQRMKLSAPVSRRWEISSEICCSSAHSAAPSTPF